MKVMVKSDRVPLALMLSGLGMAVVSQSGGMLDDNRGLLFLMGWLISGLGFLLWAIPSFNKYLKKREKARRKMERSFSDDGDQSRRYARPRR